MILQVLQISLINENLFIRYAFTSYDSTRNEHKSTTLFNNIWLSINNLEFVNMRAETDTIKLFRTYPRYLCSILVGTPAVEHSKIDRIAEAIGVTNGIIKKENN
jgi:hypothetical protein